MGRWGILWGKWVHSGCPSTPAFPGSWRKFGAVSAGARTTQVTRTRGHPSQNASPVSPGVCVPTFSSWSYPELACGRPRHVEALRAWRAAPRTGLSSRRGILRTHEEEKDFGRGAHTTQLGRERWGWRKAEGAEPTASPPGWETTNALSGLEGSGHISIGLFSPPQNGESVLLGNCSSSTWQGKMWLWSLVAV